MVMKTELSDDYRQLRLLSDADDEEPSEDGVDYRIGRDGWESQNCRRGREYEDHYAEDAAFGLLDADKTEETGEKGENADSCREDGTEIEGDDCLNSGYGGVDAPNDIHQADDYSENAFSGLFH